MDELIKTINESTDFRVELFYNSNVTEEGYQAKFFAIPDDEYRMEKMFKNPIDAIYELAEAYRLDIK